MRVVGDELRLREFGQVGAVEERGNVEGEGGRDGGGPGEKKEVLYIPFLGAKATAFVDYFVHPPVCQVIMVKCPMFVCLI